MALFYYQALERNGRKTKGMITGWRVCWGFWCWGNGYLKILLCACAGIKPCCACL